MTIHVVLCWCAGVTSTYAQKVAPRPPGAKATMTSGPRPQPALPVRPTVIRHDCGDMVRLPAGSYLMGSNEGTADEKPIHRVQVAAFEMDLTEVTVKAYRACVAAGRCEAWRDNSVGMKWSQACNYDQPDRDSHPMNCVDWNDADRFCSWAGKRLPTEEEWEYAARGIDNRRYPWGSDIPSAKRLNACGSECVVWSKQILGFSLGAMYKNADPWPTTAPVGSFPQGDSPFGLHDLAGNVWEWTASRHCSYRVPNCVDGSRILRGGGWDDFDFSNVRAALREWNGLLLRNNNLGFRCAR